MYYAMRASAPSLHRESTDSLILQKTICYFNYYLNIESIETQITSINIILTHLLLH